MSASCSVGCPELEPGIGARGGLECRSQVPPGSGRPPHPPRCAGRLLQRAGAGAQESVPCELLALARGRPAPLDRQLPPPHALAQELLPPVTCSISRQSRVHTSCHYVSHLSRNRWNHI